MAREGWSLRDLFAELKRRRVFRVAATYAAVGFVLVQAAAYVFDALLFPEWAHRMLVVFILFGFPAALVLAWAFEITPEGVRPTPGWGGGADAGGPAADDRTPATHLTTVLGVVVVATVLVAGTGWLVWTAWLAPEERDVRPATAAEFGGDLDPRRIAVLPLDDYSEGQQLGHIAKGFTEALIHELSQVESLDVISRHGVRPFRSHGVDVDSAVRVLRAGSLVEGSVERHGDDVLVTVQLVDGASSSHIASERVRGRIDATLELREELVRQVASLLRRRLGEEVSLREARGGTESSRAWELYHVAKQLAEGADSLVVREGDRDAARRLFLEADSVLALAEEADGDWAAPTVERGWTALSLARLHDPSVANALREGLREGLAHAERALSEAPDDADALTLRGSLRYYLARGSRSAEGEELFAQAEADLRRAVARDPGQAEAWARLSYVYHRQGRFAEARWALERCREADAFLLSDREYLDQASQLALDLEDLTSADSLTQVALEQYPREPAFLEKRLLYLTSAGSVPEDVEEAWSVVERFEAAASVERWGGGRLMVAGALARAELPDSARAVMGRVGVGGDAPPPHWYYGAYVSLQLGERDRALELLGRYADAAPAARAYLAREWWWRPLREDPRFRRLVLTPDGGEGETPSSSSDG